MQKFSAKQKPTSYGRGNVCWLCRFRLGMAYWQYNQNVSLVQTKYCGGL